MPASLITLGLGLAAGLHGASYGAYKDSPHESFLLRRFIREIVFALAFAAAFVWLGLDQNETPLILYLSFFALTRTATEFWKLFVRVEPQGEYRIPTQMHVMKGVVHNPLIRLAFGIGFLASIYGIYALSTLFTEMPRPLRGLLVGLSIGFAEAIAGGYKDGSIEGFHLLKFFKSPTFGALGGLIASGHTGNVMSLLLAAIGTMRMLLELVFKMVVPSYVPGKFRSMQGPFPEWMSRRRVFLIPYALTWGLYLTLTAHADWMSVDVMAASTTPVHDAAVNGAPRASDACQLQSAPAVEHDYIIRGRVRPGFFWSGRHRVGAAQLTAAGSPAGERRLELLAGTDLDRAPMRLNRWQYLAESVCGSRAELVGLSAASPEPWLDDVTNALGARPPRSWTFRELDAMTTQARLLMMGDARQQLSEGRSGFLTALGAAMQQAVAASPGGSGPATLPPQAFTHDGSSFELIADVGAVEPLTLGDRVYAQTRSVSFTVRDGAGQAAGAFDMTLGTAGAEAGVPLRVVYRPNWWVELEFLIASSTTGHRP